MKKIKLSPSALSLFLDCPLCFWLEKNEGVKRPRGIFPSLPGGMDLAIKAYFDRYRARNELPPELVGKVRGKLFPDSMVLDRWRSWRTTDLHYEDGVLGAVLSGALDDCLVDGDYYIPVDYKTRGSDIKEDPATYYQTQLDSYCLMLEANGYRTPGFSYLVYYWPLEVQEHGLVKFKVTPIRITTNSESAKKIFMDAVRLLSSKMPSAAEACQYCALVSRRRGEREGTGDQLKLF
ncbi:MAG: PD-(D/E)XK nuclease family protein [Candidatus Aureabacteria bacterium]|nr:PD-(D/E)XK nuclease family protein [Candidatus Auribacterota bacterium]